MIVELGVASFEPRINIYGATKLGAGKDFFDTKRMNGNVGKRLFFGIARHASKTVSRVFN